MEDVNLVWIWSLFLPSVSSITDILDVAYDEILQRQTMKILKRIPDLKKSEREDMDISDKQLFDTFEIVKEEFLRLLIFSNFIDNFKKNYESNSKFLDTMETRLHKMEDAIGFSLINNIKLTKTGVNDWNMFFLRIGYAQKNAKDLLNLFLDLKERTKERPGYSEKHLTTIENFKLDSEQVKEWIDSQKNLDLISFIEGKELKSLTQEQWKDLCFKRWSFLRDYFYAGSMKEQSPADLARYYEHLTYVRDTQFNDKFSIEKKYLTHISDDKVFNGGFKYAPYSCKTSAEDYHKDIIADFEPTYSWQQLFIKLDIEEAILRLTVNPNFREIHRKFDAASNLLTNFAMPVLPTKTIKSGYYYVASYIERLTNCRVLTIQGTKNCTTGQPELVDNIRKGLWKLGNLGFCDKIEKLNIKALNFNDGNTAMNTKIEGIYQTLTNLVSLQFDNTSILNLKKYKIAKDIIESKPNL